MDRKHIATMLGVPELLTVEGRRRLRHDEVSANPQLLWNAFVEIMSLGPDAFAQRPDYFAKGPRRCAALAFLYESEVQKGGHQQYFDSHQNKYHYAPETIIALRKLDAHCQADILAHAYNVVVFADACAPEYDLDIAFHACAPSLVKVLEAHLLQYETLYIEWEQ